MKKLLLLISFGALLFACNDKKEKTEATTTGDEKVTATPTDLPYTASYSSSFNENVSDADLKMVLVSYKDWADGNMENLSRVYGDSITWDNTSGEHFRMSNADIMNKWKMYRDSLSSVTIDMQAWHKMYATDKKEAYVVTWYLEIDTYKTGKADSAYIHDINQVKDGKIIELQQYKRPKK